LNALTLRLVDFSIRVTKKIFFGLKKNKKLTKILDLDFETPHILSRVIVISWSIFTILIGVK
jgi:hypothetical protein